MSTIQKHLTPRPWKANEAREALTILRSGSESNTARSFLPPERLATKNSEEPKISEQQVKEDAAEFRMKMKREGRHT